MIIRQEDFVSKVFEAIRRDTTEEEAIEEKGLQSLMLHDLRLDLELLEIALWSVSEEFDLTLQAGGLIEYLPIRIGMIERLLGWDKKRYFSKYRPITVEEAALRIYTATFKDD